jgi:iron-sulfur cluster repair protein YtfE (RIC family)
MAHECSCSHQALPPVRAEQTVGDVVHADAGALEVMKEMGINHCCGVQLTLSEAAASAGVPLATLLAALSEARKAPA